MPRSRRLLFTWAGVWTLVFGWLALAGPAAAQGGFGVSSGAGDGSDEPVVWSLWLSQEQAHPGDEIVVAIVAEVTEATQRSWDENDPREYHWHFYPREDEHRGVENSTRFSSRGYEINVQWPEPDTVLNSSNEPQPAYDGIVVFYTTVTIPEAFEDGELPTEYPVSIEVYFQACASTCIAPKSLPLDAIVEVVAEQDGVDLPNILDHSVFAGFNEKGGARALPMDEPDLGDRATVFDVPEYTNGDTSETPGEIVPVEAVAGSTISVPFLGELQTNGFLGLLLVVFLAFIGGTVLNLMPCVLPIIPIKIMGLTQASGSRGKSIFLGLMMLLGVTFLWVLIGVAIASLKQFDSVSSLFQKPMFSIGVGLFILAMGVGMMGLFTVQLPQFVYRVNPKHDSPVGAFGFGVMAAILSTPCTAPFMGASITWATQQPNTAIVIAVFIAIGVGMGWPYLVLAAFPKLVEKVPRTGPASEVVKQVLGLMMIAAAVFFTGAGVLGLLRQYPFLGPVLYWWLTAGVVGVMAFWLILRTFQITPAVGRRIAFTVIGLALFCGMGWFAYSQTQIEHFKHTNTDLWIDYDETAFANARVDGRITIVDFTADW